MTLCIVCKSESVDYLSSIFDDRYGNPLECQIVKCSYCGHIYTSPMLTEEQLGRLYSQYYPRKLVDVAQVRAEAALVTHRGAAWIRWWKGVNNQGQYSVQPGERMLDIGSGSCLALLEAQSLGAVVFGVETDPNVERIAAELGLTVHIGSFYDDPFEGEQFNLIILNQVIEHIPDPSSLLSRLHSRLAPGGRIILVFPNINSFWRRVSGYRWINWHVPYHLHHFNLTVFRKLVKNNGFNVKAWRTITPNLWTLLQICMLGESHQRGTPSTLWVKPTFTSGETTPLLISRPKLTKALYLIRRVVMIAVNIPLAILNRTLDAFGQGDSLMVEIEPSQ